MIKAIRAPLCLVDQAISLSASQTSRLQSRFRVIPTLTPPSADFSSVEGMLLHSKINQNFLDLFKNLKWIAIRAKNTSYVPPSALEKYQVFGIPSLADVGVTEHVFALLLGLTKKITLSHQNCAQGKWRQDFFPNGELYQKKLGIIGHGTIGRRVAMIAKAFQMEVLIANSASQKMHHSLDEVLSHSDYVTLHLSSKPENVHFMNERRFRQMRPGAIFINTSRGDMVDESALLKVLKEGHLGGAGLDVLEQEPPTDLALMQLPNVLVTPHVGFVTRETSARMTEALIDTILNKDNL